jgi:hypothetical protein
MEHFFKELSEKENGKLNLNFKTISTGIGEYSPYDIYDLQIDYKYQKIKIHTEIGVANIGKMSCKLPIYNDKTDFSILTRSHFFKLFKKDKKSFIIKCENPDLYKFISNLNTIDNLEVLTLNTQFELSIFGTYENNEFNIIAEYNLIYENRGNVITELIQFYKDLITELI